MLGRRAVGVEARQRAVAQLAPPQQRVVPSRSSGRSGRPGADAASRRRPTSSSSGQSTGARRAAARRARRRGPRRGPGGRLGRGRAHGEGRRGAGSAPGPAGYWTRECTARSRSRLARPVPRPPRVLSSARMKLIIQIPCLNEEETLPATLADLPREVDGLRRGRVARHRRRLDRPHGRGRARERRRPHRPPDEQQGPRRRLPGRPRRVPEARRRRDRQHRRRQPVLRRRHPEARRADRRGHGRHGRRRPPDRHDRALLAAEEAPAEARLVGRAPGLGHRRHRHDLRLPRLQPRGRDPDGGRLEVHLHARDDHPGRQAARRHRARPDPDEPEDARVAPVPVDVAPTCAATRSRSSASTRSTSRCASS